MGTAMKKLILLLLPALCLAQAPTGAVIANMWRYNSIPGLAALVQGDEWNPVISDDAIMRSICDDCLKFDGLGGQNNGAMVSFPQTSFIGTSINGGTGTTLRAMLGTAGALGTNNSIQYITLGGTGSGCTDQDPLTFTGGAGTGAAGTVNVTAGDVVSVNITNIGTGYTSAPTVATTHACTGKTFTASLALPRWKFTNVWSDAGKLYSFVCWQPYGVATTPQRSANCWLMRSDDKGVNWYKNTGTSHANAAPTNNSDAHFTGTKNGVPFFILTGADGAAPSPVVDSLDQYVYALSAYCDTCNGGSASGIWNNGDAMILMRALRPSQGGDLQVAANWTYYNSAHAGCNTTTGLNCWDTLANATDVYRNAGKTSMNGAALIPATKRHLMIQWYENTVNDNTNTSWDWLDAPHPWGPWTKFKNSSWTGSGLYNPMVWHSSLFNSPGNMIQIVSTGNSGAGGGVSIYCPWIANVLLSTETPYVLPYRTPIVSGTGGPTEIGIGTSSAGLVAAWGLNEQNGTVAHDASGNGHNFTISANCWAEKGCYFNGSTSTGVTAQMTNWTFLIAFRRTAYGIAATSNEYLADKAYDTGFWAGRHGTGTDWGCGFQQTGSPFGTFGGTWTDGTWYVLACRRSAYNGGAATATATVFQNGVQVATGALTVQTTTSAIALNLGAKIGSSQKLVGTIGGAMLFNRALTDAEILKWSTLMLNQVPIALKVQ